MRRYNTIVLILISMLLMCACSDISNLYIQGKAIGSYSSKDGVIPQKVIESNGTYYTIMDSYSGDKPFKIAIGSDVGKMEPVYTSEADKSVWFMDAEDGVVAWTEVDESGIQEVKTYNKNTKEIKTLYTTNSECVCENIIVYNNCVYFAVDEQDKKEAYIARYDIKNDAMHPVKGTRVKATKNGVNSLNCFNINEGNLVFGYNKNDVSIIRSLDADMDDDYEYESRRSVLSRSAAKYVYSVAYDHDTECIVLYYSGSDGVEATGYLCSDDDSLLFPIDYFSDDMHAYHDQIECCDGVLLYIEQMNESGDIMDHYNLIGYDLMDDKYLQSVSAAYAVSVKDSIIITQWTDGTKECKIYRGTIETKGNAKAVDEDEDFKDIAGEYQVVAVEDVENDEDYVGTWWHLSIDSKEKYLSIYDNEAGNPGVEGKIDFIDGSSLIVKIDPDYFEELPSGKWKSDGETLEVKYKKTDNGIELENNDATVSFTKEEE